MLKKAADSGTAGSNPALASHTHVLNTHTMARTFITPENKKEWLSAVRRGAKLILESDAAYSESTCQKDRLIKNALKHYAENQRSCFDYLYKKVPRRFKSLFDSELDKITTR